MGYQKVLSGLAYIDKCKTICEIGYPPPKQTVLLQEVSVRQRLVGLACTDRSPLRS